jgi:hypothetical protein
MNEINKELRGRTFGYISAALGLVAGLAWNEAISAMINALFPIAKDTVWVKFIYAIIVTIAVVILVKYLDRMFNRPHEGSK